MDSSPQCPQNTPTRRWGLVAQETAVPAHGKSPRPDPFLQLTATPTFKRIGLPHAAQVMRLHDTRDQRGKLAETSDEVVYAITSLPPHQAIGMLRLAGHTNTTATLRAYARHPKLALELTGP